MAILIVNAFAFSAWASAQAGSGVHEFYDKFMSFLILSYIGEIALRIKLAQSWRNFIHNEEPEVLQQ